MCELKKEVKERYILKRAQGGKESYDERSMTDIFSLMHMEFFKSKKVIKRVKKYQNGKSTNILHIC